MSIQITLIGLGRIGTSLGLALKRKAEVANLKIVGHDRDLQFAKTAQALCQLRSKTHGDCRSFG